MSENIELNFVSNAGQALPEAINQVKQFVRELGATADEADQISILGQLDAQVADVFSTLRSRLPALIEPIREQLNRGLVPDTAELRSGVTEILNGYREIGSAIEGVFGKADVGRGQRQAISEEINLLKELKQAAKDAGASQAQLREFQKPITTYQAADRAIYRDTGATLAPQAPGNLPRAEVPPPAPPVASTTRLYRGTTESVPGSANHGTFFTENPARAGEYGAYDPKNVQYVDVPQDVLDNSKKIGGSYRPGDHSIPLDIAQQAKSVASDPEANRRFLEESARRYTGINPAAPSKETDNLVGLGETIDRLQGMLGGLPADIHDAFIASDPALAPHYTRLEPEAALTEPTGAGAGGGGGRRPYDNVLFGDEGGDGGGGNGNGGGFHNRGPAATNLEAKQQEALEAYQKLIVFLDEEVRAGRAVQTKPSEFVRRDPETGQPQRYTIPVFKPEGETTQGFDEAERRLQERAGALQDEAEQARAEAAANRLQSQGFSDRRTRTAADRENAQREAQFAGADNADYLRVLAYAARPSLLGLEHANPAADSRPLGGGYSQAGTEFYKDGKNGPQLVTSENELLQARIRLARVLDAEAAAAERSAARIQREGFSFNRNYDAAAAEEDRQRRAPAAQAAEQQYVSGRYAATPALANIEQVNQGYRDLGGQIFQVGNVLKRQTEVGLEDITSERELLNARVKLAGQVAKQQQAQPQGFGQGLLGGLFGHGFEAGQQFNPSSILGNLGGTLGVVARYSSEYAAYAAITGSLKEVYAESQQVAEAMIHLNEVLHSTGASQVDLNEAFSTGAEYGLSEAQAITAGASGLAAYRSEIAAGANANDIFNESIKATGVAMLLTGEQADQVRAQLNAVTTEFSLGSAGQSRVNDAIANVGAYFQVNRGQLLTGAVNAGDLANVGGFSPEQLVSTIGAVNQQTGKDSSTQVVRELAGGGSARTRTAFANLGVNYDPGDLPGTLERAGEAYGKLTKAEQTNFAVSLGGSRTAETVIALLKQQPQILDATAKAYDNGGAAVEEANRKQDTFAGQLRQIGALAKDVAAELAKSGLLDFFGAVLLSIKPVLQLMDDLLKASKDLGGGLLGGHGVGSLVVPALGLRALAGLGGGKGLLGRSTGEDGAVSGTIANARGGVGRIFRRGGSTDAPEDAAQSANTEATQANTQATTTHTETVTGNTDAIAANTQARTAEADAEAAATDATVGLADAEVAATSAAEELAALNGELAAGERAALEALTQLAAETDVTAASMTELEAMNQGFIDSAAAASAALTELAAAAEADTAAELENATAKEVGGAESVVPGGGAGLPIMGPLIAALVTAVVVDQIVNAVSNINSARKAGDKAAADTGVSGDTADLRARAKTAQEAAAQIAHSEGGIFGGIGKLLTGGEGDNTISKDRDLAKNLNDLADEIDKIKADNANAGRYGSIDVSSADTVTNSLDAMQKSGASAAEQLAVLNKALDSVAQNGQGAARNLLPVDAQIAGAVAGKAAQQALDNQNQQAADVFARELAKGGPGKAFTDKPLHERIGALGQKGLGGQLDSIATDFTTYYLQQDPSFDPKNAKDSADYKTQLSQRLAAGVPGFTKLDDKDQQAIVDNIYKGLATSLGQIDYSKVSPGALAALVAGQAAQAKAVSDQIASAVTAGQGYGYTKQGTADLTELDQQRGLVAGTQSRLDKATADANSGRGGDNLVARLQSQLGRQQGVLNKDQSQYDKSSAAYDKSNTGDEANVQAAKSYLDTVTKAYNDAVKQGNLGPDKLKELNKNVTDATNEYSAALTQQYNDSVTIAQSQLAVSDTLGRARVKLSQDLKNAALLHGYARRVADAANKDEQAQLDIQAAQDIASRISTGEVRINDNTGQATAGNALNYDPRNKLQNDINQRQGDQVQLYAIAQQEIAAGLKQHTQAYNDLFKKIAQEDQTIAQDYVDGVNSAVAAAADPRSALDNANVQITQAKNTMALYAQGSPEWNNAQTQLKQGYVALIAAQVADAKNIFLLGRDQTDPVQQAAADAFAAADKLQKDRASNAEPDVIRGDQIDLNAKNQANQKAALDQFLSDNQTNYDLHRISFTTYLKNLESRDALLKQERAGLSKTSEGYRQLTDEINTVEKDILNATNQLQGQFNLGDIKIPSIYEVRRQVATGNAGTGFSDNRVTSVTINGIGSTQEVVQIVKAQLGATATVNRAPVATRKA